jgi:hypothetical protein
MIFLSPEASLKAFSWRARVSDALAEATLRKVGVLICPVRAAVPGLLIEKI